MPGPIYSPPLATAPILKLYADYIKLYLAADKANIQCALDKIAEFTALGGYQINHAKSEALLFGCSAEVLPTVMAASFQARSPIRYLGVRVTTDYADHYNINYKSLIDKSRTLLQCWDNLPVTIIGRISLIKMNLLLVFLFASANIMIKILNSFFETVEADIRTFIRQKKHPRAKLLN
ncbi:hypothetical protein NDU88_000508 [Pleurodeles waltl]|uniref:Reverse transcriptase domain-containing protein n=1 Tax=Pleurodeles waltl TaxID=8319 RepID=A0AAV7Q4D4_PLEWA|nr:hypothetical protein NDU88_000508 [Pleurodeles waltl]